MAEAHLMSARLRIVYDYGLDEDNKPIYKSKTFHNVNQYATADELYLAAHAIGSLKSEPIWSIEKNEMFLIDE